MARGRSKGYRATAETRDEMDALRMRLGTCRLSDWQKARAIMQQIVQLTGQQLGPSGSSVEPRSCRYCGYFGHSRQNCKKYKKDVKDGEAKVYEKEIAAHRRFMEQRQRERTPADVAWAAWIDWSDAMYDAACAQNLGCEREEPPSCNICTGCQAWDDFCDQWKLEHPEPRCTISNAPSYRESTTVGVSG